MVHTANRAGALSLRGGAAAVDVFFTSLIFSWIGGPVASLAWSLGLGCVIGAPAMWYFARHIRHLIDVAEGREAA
jgi:hypothetical protein